MFHKNPILITNENYIYDVATETKYYWKDIEDASEDGPYLYIKLHDPKAYLNKIGDPFKRLITNINYEPNSEETPYKINLDLIDINQNLLLEILDDHIAKDDEPENALDTSNSITYYFTWGRTTKFLLFQLILFSSSMLPFSFGKNKDYNIVFLLVFLLVTIILPQIIRLLFFWIRKKPVLSVNKSFIYDHYNGIQYDWGDINEVIATGDYLVIKLNEPLNYLNKIKNPFGRFIKKYSYKIFKAKPSFSINMSILDIKKGEDQIFLDTLNDFSIAAEAHLK